MGLALMWIEGLAAAIFAIALALRWATRGPSFRLIWVAIVFLVFIAAPGIVVGAYLTQYEVWRHVRTSWLAYAVAWLITFVALFVALCWKGLRRIAPASNRAAQSWSRRFLWSGFSVATFGWFFTFWNADLSVRADLVIARQDAAAFITSLSPAPRGDSPNAADVYREAFKALEGATEATWSKTAKDARSRSESVDWTAPEIVELVQQNEKSLKLLRQASEMPACRFDDSPSDYVALLFGDENDPEVLFRKGMELLAIDARVQAALGNAAVAAQDIEALFRFIHHAPEFTLLGWRDREIGAWLTLQEALRLSRQDAALLELRLPELVPLVRKARQQHALWAMLFPVIASEPSERLLNAPLVKRQKSVALKSFFFAWIYLPAHRVFLLPDELIDMRQALEAHRQAPRLTADETPADWSKLKNDAFNALAGAFSVWNIKPRQMKISADAEDLSLLRELSRAGLAAAKYRKAHGDYPERLDKLVGEYVDALPVDRRDGRPLRIKRFPNEVVIYAAANSKRVEANSYTDPNQRRWENVFRMLP